MVATYLQDELIEELKRIFNHFRLKNPNGELSQINIYSQDLPIPKPANPPDGDLDPELVEEGLGLSDITNDEDPYPYIIVRVNDGEITAIDGDQKVGVFLILGVTDPNLDNQGHKDVLNMIQKIYERFAKNAILANQYELVMPINWALQDEASYPYFIGGMTLNFITHPIRREDQYA